MIEHSHLCVVVIKLFDVDGNSYLYDSHRDLQNLLLPGVSAYEGFYGGSSSSGGITNVTVLRTVMMRPDDIEDALPPMKPLPKVVPPPLLKAGLVGEEVLRFDQRSIEVSLFCYYYLLIFKRSEIFLLKLWNLNLK